MKGEGPGNRLPAVIGGTSSGTFGLRPSSVPQNHFSPRRCACATSIPCLHLQHPPLNRPPSFYSSHPYPQQPILCQPPGIWRSFTGTIEHVSLVLKSSTVFVVLRMHRPATSDLPGKMIQKGQCLDPLPPATLAAGPQTTTCSSLRASVLCPCIQNDAPKPCHIGFLSFQPHSRVTSPRCHPRVLESGLVPKHDPTSVFFPNAGLSEMIYCSLYLFVDCETRGLVCQVPCCAQSPSTPWHSRS